jgi:hypothetical protein
MAPGLLCVAGYFLLASVPEYAPQDLGSKLPPEMIIISPADGIAHPRW